MAATSTLTKESGECKGCQCEKIFKKSHNLCYLTNYFRNVRLNLINLNKQGKMYNQGMAPVTRTLPGKPQWERIRDRPIQSLDDNTFTLTFKYRTSDNVKATTFFAFTYPFSFAELQIALNSIDLKLLPTPSPQTPELLQRVSDILA